MAWASLLQSGSTRLDGPLDGQLLSVAIAWAVIAILCYFNAIPLSNSRVQQTSFTEKKLRRPQWFQNRYFDAALVFTFHAMISVCGRMNTWILPLVTIIISLSPQSRSHLDSNVVNLSQTVSSWKTLLKLQEFSGLKPIGWLAAAVFSILSTWLLGCSWAEFGIGIATVLIGLSLYIHLPESVLRHDLASVNDLQRHLLLPVALQSITCAMVIWEVFGGQVLAPRSLIFLSLVAMLKGIAVLLSVIDGTGLPILAALSGTTILQTTVKAFPLSLFGGGALLISTIIQFEISLPKSSEKRRKLWLYVVTPLMITSIAQGLYGGTTFDAFLLSRAKHPIQILHEQHMADFQRKLSNQSHTYDQAKFEYQRRYGRRPPPRFEKWFELAKTNEFQLVDEFDSIMESIIPFWGISSHLLRDRVRKLDYDAGMVTLSVSNGNATFGKSHYHAKRVLEWIENYADYKLLPDFDFVINVYDEPRLNAPYEAVQFAVNRAQLSSPSENGNTAVGWTRYSRINLKANISAACPPDINAFAGQKSTLQFVSNVTASKDYCQNPVLFSNHGFFKAPETLILTNTLVPFLSQCKPDRFNDIPYPSPYYHELEDLEKQDELLNEKDLDWEFKSNSLYWSGSSTGGHNNVDNWRHMHRQHLALLAGEEADTPLQLLASPNRTSGNWTAYSTTWSAVKELMDFRLNRVVQCDKEACAEMQASFPLIGQRDAIETSFGSKYALDIDGNTFSGRFYRLLKSKACVLKMTTFKEWHDDFLFPWVHYVPVSSGYEELGEIMNYFQHDISGRVVGKVIAGDGRTWARKTLRKVDRELVAMRILMEVARLVTGVD